MESSTNASPRTITKPIKKSETHFNIYSAITNYMPSRKIAAKDLQLAESKSQFQYYFRPIIRRKICCICEDRNNMYVKRENMFRIQHKLSDRFL
jgi:hypothetical protein